MKWMAKLGTLLGELSFHGAPDEVLNKTLELIEAVSKWEARS